MTHLGGRATNHLLTAFWVSFGVTFRGPRVLSGAHLSFYAKLRPSLVARPPKWVMYFEIEPFVFRLQSQSILRCSNADETCHQFAILDASSNKRRSLSLVTVYEISRNIECTTSHIIQQAALSQILIIHST